MTAWTAQTHHHWQPSGREEIELGTTSKRLKHSDEMELAPSASSSPSHVVAHLQTSPLVDPGSDQTVIDDILNVGDDVSEHDVDPVNSSHR